MFWLQSAFRDENSLLRIMPAPEGGFINFSCYFERFFTLLYSLTSIFDRDCFNLIRNSFGPIW
jgi:hypothetical protein